MANNNDGLSPEQLKKLADRLQGLEKVTDDITKAEEEHTKIVDKNKEALKAFGSYLGNIGKTIASAEQGSAKYGKAVTGATDALGGLADMIPFVGKAFGFLIRQMGAMATASLKQNDALIKSYRTLSDFGNLDTRGLEGVLDTILKLGGNTENLENVNRVLRDIAPMLVTFGGTVNQGTRKFSEFVEPLLKGDFYRQLQNLGYSTDDIVKYAGQFVSTSTRAGTSFNKNTGEMTELAARYMKIFAELTALTGKSRDEQQKIVDDMLRDVSWQAYLSKLNESDKEYASRLNAMIVAFSAQNKESGAVLKELYMNAGGVTTEFAAKLSPMYTALYEDSKKRLASSANEQEASRAAFHSFKANINPMIQYRNQFRDAMIISKDFSTQMGFSADMFIDFGRIGEMNVDEMEKQIKLLTQSNRKENERVELESKRETAERLTRQAMEKLWYVTGDLVTPAITGLAQMVNNLSRVIANVVYWLTSGRIGSLLGFDTPVDFRGVFREFNTMADVTKALNEEQQKQKDLLEERNKLDAEIVSHEQKLEPLRKAAAAEIEANKSRPDYKQSAGAQNALAVAMARDLSPLRQRREAINAAIRSSQESQGVARAAATGITGTGISFTGEGTDELKNLPLRKTGDVHEKGSALSPKLVELANKIVSSGIDIAHISSLNDIWHKKNKPGSAHTRGLALDFVLGPEAEKRILDKETGKQYFEEVIKKKLIQLGASPDKILDEYNNKSDQATGHHIHAEVSGKTQGLFKGPESGYYLKAHGEEVLLNKQGLTNLITKAQVAGSGSLGQGGKEMLSVLTQQNSLLEDLFEEFRRNHDTQKEILRYIKV